jgi:hypothetical protein
MDSTDSKLYLLLFSNSKIPYNELAGRLVEPSQNLQGVDKK